MDLRVVNAEPLDYPHEALSICASLGSYWETQDSLLSYFSQYQADVLITRLGHQITRDVIAAASPSLKAIVVAAAHPNWIDLPYAKLRGVDVLSLTGETGFLYNIRATSEHTWGLILSLLRHIPQAHSHVTVGGWDRDLFRGHDLFGKRLGILGVGRLGAQMARVGIAMGMDVGGYDLRKGSMTPGVAYIANLQGFLVNSDIVTIHLPLDDSTHQMIGAAELSWMPKGSYLINTSAGGIVNEVALLGALQSGHLAGAALDVLTHEGVSLSENHPLLLYAREHDNLLLTPHIGGATVESMAKCEIFMARKLKSWAEEKGYASENPEAAAFGRS